jgi:hypothetical protein
MSRHELRCSHATHAENSNQPGWDDGVLAVVENARIIPTFVCLACAKQLHEAPQPRTKDQDTEERLALLESKLEAIEMVSK